MTMMYLPIESTALVIFSNSSGQMSGQWVNPKYSSTHLPRKSELFLNFPFWSISSQVPPSDAFPSDFVRSFSIPAH